MPEIFGPAAGTRLDPLVNLIVKIAAIARSLIELLLLPENVTDFEGVEVEHYQFHG